MTFTIGRGNDIVRIPSLTPFVITGRAKRFLNFVLVTSQVCSAIQAVASRLLNRDIEELFANMGKTWDYLVADPQLRW